MDFNHQNQQPQPNQAAAQPSNAATQPSVASKKKKRLSRPRLGSQNKNTTTSWALVAICIILVVFGLLWFFRGHTNEASEINTKEYQAIFLSNGQVYFGHIDKLNSQYAKLTDIFYLQSDQTVQPKDDKSSQSSGSTHLVKLGNEIHGPEDEMMINRKQLLFWENLKPSGKVTKAIGQYNKSGGDNNSNSSNSNPAPTSSNDNSSAPTNNGGSSNGNNTSTNNPGSSDSGNSNSKQPSQNPSKDSSQPPKKD